MFAEIGLDGDVLEVDEAGCLEAVEDRLGCLKLQGFVSLKELGEVDELFDGLVAYMDTSRQALRE